MARRLALIAVCLCAAVALLAPAAAQARPSMFTTIEAPRDLMSTNLRNHAFDQIGSLGVHNIRVELVWGAVAPSSNSRRRPKVDTTNPANYHWGAYDAEILTAAARGMGVVLTVSPPGPRWSSPAHNGITRPNPRDFENFMIALGRHYGGKITAWSIWNEPNHPRFLLPQYGRHHRMISPGLYRQLFLAAWRGLRLAGRGADPILMGETAPVATKNTIAPLAFLRGVLCLSARYRKNPRCSNLPADGFAMHPYTTRIGPFYRPANRDDVTIGVLGRLTRALDLAARAGAIRRNLPIYITEFGTQSFPNHLLGVPPGQQAEFNAMAERLAYYNSRVVSFAQFLLRDDPHSGGKFLGRLTYQSGLEYANGRQKPAYNAFRLPLVALRRGSHVALWGHVRPAGATVAGVWEGVHAGRRFRVRRVALVHTNAYGVFSRSVRFRSHRLYRLQWVDSAGHRWTGAWVRVYSSSGRVQ